MNITKIYEILKDALKKEIQTNNLQGQNVRIRCRALRAEEAIGTPEHNDYPIIKGKEIMVEAVFNDARGQAFTDEYENKEYKIEELLENRTESNRERASFIAGFNAVFRHLGLCDRTIHCKDMELKECAENLPETVTPEKNVLLIGHQPRFLEILASTNNVRIVDLDRNNIGREVSGVIIDPPEKTAKAILWCDLIFATGSTLVNGTITDFLNSDKPVIFYGVTISAAAAVLGLNSYCHCGH